MNLVKSNTNLIQNSSKTNYRDSGLLFTITIPDFENKYQISKAQRAKYYTWKDYIKKRVPKKYKNYIYKKSFGKKEYIVDKAGNRALKNTRSVGKPKFIKLNGQSFYNGSMNPIVRSKLVKYFHKYFIKHINKSGLEALKLNPQQYLDVKLVMYETKDEMTIDVSNLWIYTKLFDDALVRSNIIKDDNPEYIRSTGIELVLCKDTERRLECKISIVNQN